jgi:hypothetical protein
MKQYNLTIKYSLKGSRGYKRKEGSTKERKNKKKHMKEIER